MKKIHVFLLVLTLISLFAFGGSATGKPIEISWTIIEGNSVGAFQDLHRELAKQIEKVTEGRVTMKIYWSGVLGALPDFLKMVKNGSIAQGGTFVMTFYQWDLPFWAAPGMPFLSKGYRQAALATWELGKEYAPMQEQLKSKNLKLLGVAQAHETTIGRNKPFNRLSDLKGEKFWVVGFWQAVAASLGLTNVSLRPAEAPDALHKGLVTGYWGITYQASRWQKFYESIKNIYGLRYGGQTMLLLAVNSNVWAKIAPADQAAIEKVAYDLTFNWYPKLMDKEGKELRDFYKSVGVTERDLHPDDAAMIEKLGPDVIWKDWLATAEKRGLPGKEWMDLYRAKVKDVAARLGE